jgi:23S rRNA (uracil1939-C5)-methyltransferase
VLVRRAIALVDPARASGSPTFLRHRQLHAPAGAACGAAVGIEGSAALVARATENAAFNGLAGKATFRVANLFEATPESFEALGSLQKILVDPPREGAIELVKSLPGDGSPQRIVYVSCKPGDARARCFGARPRSRL